jgi:hypothetical protein
VQGYASIRVERTREHATEAVKNLKKKASGQINVRRAACVTHANTLLLSASCASSYTTRFLTTAPKSASGSSDKLQKTTGLPQSFSFLKQVQHV